MKARLIERLDLLAELGEAAWLREIARQNRVLARVAEQRALLRGYREKLAQSWRSGGVVGAGTARRAADFDAASRHADAQLDLMERQAAQETDRARMGFAAAQARRRGLAAAQREVAAAADRTAAARLERAQPAVQPKRRTSP